MENSEQPNEHRHDKAVDDVEKRDVLGAVADQLPKLSKGRVLGISLDTWFDRVFRVKILKIAGIALLVSVFVPVSIFPFVFLWDFNSLGALVAWPVVVAMGYLGSAFLQDGVKNADVKIMLHGLPFVLALSSVVFVGWGNFSSLFVGNAKEALGGHLSLLAIGYPMLLTTLIFRLRWPELKWARYLIGVGALFCVPGFLRHVAAGLGMMKGGFLVGVHNVLFGILLFLAACCVLFVPTARQFSFVRSMDRLLPYFITVFLAWVPLQVLLIFVIAISKFGLGSLFLGVHSLVVAFAYLGVLVVTAPALVKRGVDYWEKKA